MQNHGFIAEPIGEGDLTFGSAWDLKAKGFKGVALQPDGDWEKHLYDLIYTHQAPLFETNACVSHGTANIIELLMKRVHGLQDDRSDRFIAKASGTDPARGNTPKAVAQFIRDSGASSEGEWPASPAKDVNEYYSTIPTSLFTLAKTWRDKFKFGYERIDPPTVANLKEALKYSPVGISCSYMLDSDGFWFKPEGWRDGHWVVLLKIREDGIFVLLDSYQPYIKLHKPFAPEVAMRYALDYEKYDLLSQLIELLKSFVAALKRKSTV